MQAKLIEAGSLPGPAHLVSHNALRGGVMLGSLDGSICLWPGTETSPRLWVKRSSPAIDLAVHSSAAGSYVALAEPEGVALLSPCGAEVSERVRPDEGQFRAVVALDDETFVTADELGRIIWWSRTSGRRLLVRKLHRKAIHTLLHVVQPAGPLLLSIADDRLVSVVDARSGSPMHQLSGHVAWIREASTLQPAAGQLLLAVVDRAYAVVWDVLNGVEVRRLDLPDSRVTSFAATAGEGRTRLALGALDGSVHIAIDGEQSLVRSPLQHDGRVTHLCYVGDDLISVGVDGAVTSHTLCSRLAEAMAPITHVFHINDRLALVDRTGLAQWMQYTPQLRN